MDLLDNKVCPHRYRVLLTLTAAAGLVVGFGPHGASIVLPGLADARPDLRNHLHPGHFYVGVPSRSAGLGMVRAPLRPSCHPLITQGPHRGRDHRLSHSRRALQAGDPLLPAQGGAGRVGQVDAPRADDRALAGRQQVRQVGLQVSATLLSRRSVHIIPFGRSQPACTVLCRPSRSTLQTTCTVHGYRDRVSSGRLTSAVGLGRTAHQATNEDMTRSRPLLLEPRRRRASRAAGSCVISPIGNADAPPDSRR